MSRQQINTSNKEFTPTPNVVLTNKVGSRIIGRLKKKVESQMFPGKLNYLIELFDTNASTQLYNKETKITEEVNVAKNDYVWLKETAIIRKAFDQVEEGTIVEVVYTGKGEAKKGRKAPYLFEIFTHDEEK